MMLMIKSQENCRGRKLLRHPKKKDHAILEKVDYVQGSVGVLGCEIDDVNFLLKRECLEHKKYYDTINQYPVLQKFCYIYI